MAESDISTKACKLCGEIKPLDCFYLSPRNKTDGRHSWCIPCFKVRRKKQWDEATPEMRSAAADASRARMHADPEAHRARSLAWKDKNREKVNARTRELRTINAEHLKEKRKHQPSGSPEYIRLSAQRYRERHPDRVKAYRVKYQSENLEKFAVWARNRRARIREVGGSHTVKDIEALFKKQRGKCACCRKSLKLYHVDHIESIARGGTNDRLNLQLLCPPCNLQKRARDPIEFMQSRGFLL